MTRIYRYVLETDCGMAPCSQNGLISLGTCKPGIRRMARPGDWAAGFMPGTMNRGELVWAGQVAEPLSHDEYRERFPERRDAIYAKDEAGKYVSRLAGYHCDPTDRERDTDHPVLLFDQARSRYLGRRPVQLPHHLMHLAAEGRNYRVNFRRDGDLEKWEEFVGSLPGAPGEPRDELVLCPGCRHCAGNATPPVNCGSRKRPGRIGKSCSVVAAGAC